MSWIYYNNSSHFPSQSWHTCALFLPSVITTSTEVMTSVYGLSIPTQYTPLSSNLRFVSFTNSPLHPPSTMWDLWLFLVRALFSESTTISHVPLDSPRHQYFLLYRKCFVSYVQIRRNSPPMCAVIFLLSQLSWRLAENTKINQNEHSHNNQRHIISNAQFHFNRFHSTFWPKLKC